MDEMQAVPYIAHESMMVRMERTNHRLWILCIILVICLVASNVGWFLYDQQFETYEEQTVTQESDTGSNNFIGSDGDIYYGEADGNN